MFFKHFDNRGNVLNTTPGRRYVMPAAKHPGSFRNTEFEKLSPGPYALGRAEMKRNELAVILNYVYFISDENSSQELYHFIYLTHILTIT